MKVVILAGGLGTRISEETVTRPKPMIEIGGRPIGGPQRARAAGDGAGGPAGPPLRLSAAGGREGDASHREGGGRGRVDQWRVLRGGAEGGRAARRRRDDLSGRAHDRTPLTG